MSHSAGRDDAGRPTLRHQPALDGVRGLAVAAVVLYHGGVRWIHGGFLGVDVFFVLSGFLITSLLLTELRVDARVRLGRFYERRARRLLPGLAVLVLLVAVYAALVSPHGTFPSLPLQVVGTMLYVGNWTLIGHHATYFTRGLLPSPLEHTWSLAIEEQFYLVWPLVLVGIARVVRRREGLAACCVLGALVATAITWLQQASGTNLNSLYLATQTHVPTLLVGAAAACLLLRRGIDGGGATYEDPPPRHGAAISVVALAGWAGVVATFVFVNGTGSFLYTGGYLAVGVLVAVAIGATVVTPAGVAARTLSYGPVAYLGRISYGVYLYHFPLFLWLDSARTHLGGSSLLAVRLLATLLVARASFALIEQPVRQRRVLHGRVGLASSAVGFAAVGVLAFSLASAATAVPFADRVARWDPVTRAPAGTRATVLIVGDSMARTLGAGLNNPLAVADRVFFAVNGVAQCSLVPGTLAIKGFRVRQPQRCDATGPRGFPSRWRRSIARYHPELSMLLFRLDLVDHRADGGWQHVGEPRYDCELGVELVRAAAVLASTGHPVVFLTTPYYDSGEQTDGSRWPEDATSRVHAYNTVLEHVAVRFPGVVHVVDLSRWVSPSHRFTRTIGSTVVRWVDGIHFTYAGDALVLPKLLAAVASIAHDVPTPGALSLLEHAAATATLRTCAANPAP